MKIDKGSKKNKSNVSGSGTLVLDASDFETAQTRSEYGKGGNGLPLGTYTVEVVKAELRVSKSTGVMKDCEQISLRVKADPADNNGQGGTDFFDATFHGSKVPDIINLYRTFGVYDDYISGSGDQTQIKIAPADVVKSWEGTKIKFYVSKGKGEYNGVARRNLRLDPLPGGASGAKKVKKAKAAK